ncbi:hypothetical protein Tco_1308072 [Tanacetum coccineum]
MKSGEIRLTKGTVLAYALEYNDEKRICFFTDFLVVGENQQTFDLEGDSGSLIVMKGENYEKPRPIGIIWGGTANKGRLKLKVGQPPKNWTSGVDLGRLLNLLEPISHNNEANCTKRNMLPKDKSRTMWDITSQQHSPAKNCCPDIESCPIRNMAIWMMGPSVGPSIETSVFKWHSPLHRNQRTEQGES